MERERDRDRETETDRERQRERRRKRRRWEEENYYAGEIIPCCALKDAVIQKSTLAKRAAHCLGR